MNPADQAQIDILLKALGHHPFGTPGFGPTFGGLPAMQQMPPGTSFLGGGTFFGPQLYNPYHMSFGSGPFGGLLGYGVENMMASRGYTYMPRGANVMDVMQGRQLERGLEGAVDIGRGFDEQRLARGIEAGLNMFMQNRPMNAANANVMASIMAGPMSALGLMRYAPGGSAEDFARSMYMATQNMRDFTRTEYGLGLPAGDAQATVRRLLDFFTPVPGMVSRQQTRGMGLGDIGQMASALTGFGLIGADVRPGQIRDLAQELGVTMEDLSGPQVEQLRGITRTANIGEQLKTYAEIMGTMRDIMGAPDAPIPAIINNLQQLTGNALQQMPPDRLQNLLFQVKETARATNVAMDSMMLILQEGSNMAQQMGLPGLAGAQMAMEAVGATVAAQTTAMGPFPGRLAPQQQLQLQWRRLARGRRSEAARVNVQVMQMLDEIRQGGPLTPEQQTAFGQLEARANEGYFTEQNWQEAVTQLGVLGVEPGRAFRRLRSNVGVDRWLAENPDYDVTILARQDVEAGREMADAVRRRFGRRMGRGSTDRLVQQLDRAAESSGMSAEELLGLLGNAPVNTTTGSIAEMESWLTEQGVDVGQLNLHEFYGEVESMQRVQNVYRSREVQDRRQFAMQFGRPAGAAREELGRLRQRRVAGQQLLVDIHAEQRGGALERIMGAIVSDQPQTLEELAMSAFGFMPTEEIQRNIGEGWVKRMSSLQAELQGVKDDPLKQDRAAAIRQEMRDLTDEAREFAPGGSLAGVDRTRGARQVLDALDEDTQRAADILADTSKTDAERLQAAELVSRRLSELPPGAMEALQAELRGPMAEQFRGLSATVGAGAWTLQSQLRRLNRGNLSPDDARRLRQDILGGSATNMGFGVGAIRGIARATERRVRGRAAAEPKTPRQRVELYNEFVRTLNELADPDLQDPAGVLARLADVSYDAEGVLFTRDPETGDYIPNENLIRQATLLNEDVYGDSKAAATAANPMRSNMNRMLEVLQVHDVMDLSSMTPEMAENLRQELKKYGTLDGKPISILQGVGTPSARARMAMREGAPGPYGDIARSIRGVRGILGMPMDKRGGLAQSMLAEYAKELLQTGQMFERTEAGGVKLTKDLRQMILGMHTDPSTGELVGVERALGLISALEEVGALGAAAEKDPKKAAQIMQDAFDKWKAKEDADKPDKAAGDKEGTQFKIRLSRDGQVIEPGGTIDVDISLNDEGTNKGREASRTGSRKSADEYSYPAFVN
jgi:hypothetical protein